MKIRYLSLLLLLFILPVSVSAYYVDFSQSYGSFGTRSTAGMFYSDVDVLFYAPVRLMEFKGTALLTSFGNYRNYNSIVSGGTNFEQYLKWRNSDSTYYSIGVVGYPLWLLKMDQLRGGVFTFQWGKKSATYDLNRSGTTNAEANYTSATNMINNTNGSVIRTVNIAGKEMKYYTDQSIQTISVGAAYKLTEKFDIGFGFQIQKDATLLTTGGSKTWSIVSNTGKVNRSASLTYPAQDAEDQNSTATYSFRVQADYGLSDIMKIFALVSADIQKKNNPNSWKKDLVTGTLSSNNLETLDSITVSGGANNQGAYDSYTFPTTLAGGFFDYTSPNPVNLGTASYEDKRANTDIGIQLETDFKYEKIVILNPIILFQTRLGGSIDDSRIRKWSVSAQKRVALNQVDSYSRSQTITETYKDGSTKNSGIGGGLKLSFINMNDVKLNMGCIYWHDNSGGENYTYTETIANNWSYENPAVVNPGDPSGGAEGTRTETKTTSYKYEKDVSKNLWQIPVGTIISISTRWNFKAGAAYSKTFTTTTVTRKDENKSRVTTVAPQTGNATTAYETTSYTTERKSVAYQETSSTAYNYGIEFNYNENLCLEFNAFLDNNTGSVGGAGGAPASLLDLNTYRMLAISASYRY